MSCLVELRVCRDAVAEPPQLGHATGLDVLPVSLSAVLLIGCVGDAEDVKVSAGSLGGVCAPQALLDVCVPSAYEQEFQSFQR